MVLLRLGKLPSHTLLARSIHASATRYSNIPLSQFDKDYYLPYERLADNVETVKKRYALKELQNVS